MSILISPRKVDGDAGTGVCRIRRVLARQQGDGAGLVFADVDAQRGSSIRCDFKTGAITLAPGSYHMTGFSMAMYNSGGEPPEMITVRSPAAAGYCRLRTYDPKATVDPSNMLAIPNEDPGSMLCYFK
jgi:hypothetical protein